MRSYKRKTDRQSWDPEKLEEAVKAVEKKKMSLKKASETYEIPLSTLSRKVKEFKGGKKLESVCVKGEFSEIQRCYPTSTLTTLYNFDFSTGFGGFQTVFTPEQENLLCKYIRAMDSKLFGLTSEDVRYLAYQVAVRENIKNNFNKELQIIFFKIRWCTCRPDK